MLLMSNSPLARRRAVKIVKVAGEEENRETEAAQKTADKDKETGTTSQAIDNAEDAEEDLRERIVLSRSREYIIVQVWGPNEDNDGQDEANTGEEKTSSLANAEARIDCLACTHCTSRRRLRKAQHRIVKSAMRGKKSSNKGIEI